MAKRAEKKPGAQSQKTVERDVEHGASGTPNFGGYIFGEDYNKRLDGTAGLAVYDEMRRSDAQVHASLNVLKLPLESATWSIRPPDNPTPQELEVADYCQRALFEKGAMADSWSYVLEHINMMLEFGCSTLEKVFTLGDDGRIRYARLAPRLPKTITRIEVNEQGQLSKLVQYAAKGSSGNIQELAIEASYLAHFTHKREGDNYLGRSELRSAYPHWFMKKEAYRIGLIRLHRFGVGIPMVELDKAVVDTDNKAEMALLDATLRGMASHEAAYIRTVKGIDWSILVPTGGQGGDDSIKDFVEHHNLMIARNVLANFLGETGDGLNSGRTRSLLDFFISAVSAVGANICGTCDIALIRPLCDLNFAMQGLRYPTLAVADVADTDVKMLAETLTKLSPAGFITPDDDTEDMLRKLLGMPALADEARGRVRVPEKAVVPPADPAPALRQPASALSLRQTKSGRTFELNGRIYARQPTSFETRIFSLSEVPDTLDLETRALAGVLASLRRQQLETLATQVAKKDARSSTGAFTDIRPDEFAVPLKADVQREFAATLQRAADFGIRQVRLELHRQGATVDLSAAPGGVPGRALDGIFRLDANPSAGASKRTLKSALTTSAKVTTERETDAWFNRILETGVRLRRAGVQGDALAVGIVDTLGPEIDAGTLRTAKGEVNEGFALGRATEAESHKSEIDLVEYSCLLDANSCTPCADLDGQQFAYGSDMYYSTMPPYRSCDGNRGAMDACRCAHLFLYKGR